MRPDAQKKFNRRWHHLLLVGLALRVGGPHAVRPVPLLAPRQVRVQLRLSLPPARPLVRHFPGLVGGRAASVSRILAQVLLPSRLSFSVVFCRSSSVGPLMPVFSVGPLLSVLLCPSSLSVALLLSFCDALLSTSFENVALHTSRASLVPTHFFKKTSRIHTLTCVRGNLTCVRGNLTCVRGNLTCVR
jgi:hypothetical protein